MPKAKSKPVQNDRQHWSPGSGEPTSIANCRVSLALLKMYRAVDFGPAETDTSEVITSLWPVIQTEWHLLIKGIEATVGSKRKKPPFTFTDDTAPYTPEWVIDLYVAEGPESTEVSLS